MKSSFRFTLINLISFLAFRDSALNLINLYFHINGILSETTKLLYGVPQGNVLSTLQLCIYMLSLCVIMRSHDIHYHIYADDTQFLFPLI